MEDVKFIKLFVDFVNDNKIKQIRKIPCGNDIAFIWVLLLCLAGKTNDAGMIYLTSEIPYTDELLAIEFDYPLNTIKLALEVFKNFGMIEIIDNIIYLSNWSKYQNIDALEKRREKDRLRQKKHRDSIKLRLQEKNDTNSCVLPEGKDEIKNISGEDSSESNVTHNVTVTQCHTDREKKEERRKKKGERREEKEERENIKRDFDVERVIEQWNSLDAYGITPVTRIGKTSMRYKNLCARLDDYGVEDVIHAIREIEESDFLQGKTEKGWTITFDWFVLPTNYIKVAEGNYRNKKKKVERRTDLDDIM